MRYFFTVPCNLKFNSSEHVDHVLGLYKGNLKKQYRRCPYPTAQGNSLQRHET